jgi:hypothetical protein
MDDMVALFLGQEFSGLGPIFNHQRRHARDDDRQDPFKSTNQNGVQKLGLHT